MKSQAEMVEEYKQVVDLRLKPTVKNSLAPYSSTNMLLFYK